MIFGSRPLAGLAAAPVDLLCMTKRLILKEIMPTGFTSDLIEKMFKKTLRLRLWRALKPEARALILVLRKWAREGGSSTLKAILEKIYVEIKLGTLRGCARLCWIAVPVRNDILRYLVNTCEELSNIWKLVCLRIS